MITGAASKVPSDIGVSRTRQACPIQGGGGFGTEHKALLIEAEVEAAY